MCLTKHDASERTGGVEIQLHALWNMALTGSEWSASYPGRFTPREWTPNTQLIGGWMGKLLTDITAPIVEVVLVDISHRFDFVYSLWVTVNLRGHSLSCLLWSETTVRVHSNINWIVSRRKNLKIKICKTVILPVVLYGCETWSHTLKEKQRLRIFGPKRRKTDRGEKCIMMNFTACILHWILLRWLNQGEWGGLDMWHACGMGDLFTGFWLGGPKGRDHLVDLGVGEKITLNWTLGR
jgi:hypothetical protein